MVLRRESDVRDTFGLSGEKYPLYKIPIQSYKVQTSDPTQEGSCPLRVFQKLIVSL